MSGPALLDVNVLVALFDPDHPHHEPSHDWFAENDREGWATCPLTENGFLRSLSHPKYSARGMRPPEVLELLRTFCASRYHVFWPDAISLRDTKLFNPSYLSGHRQLTDVYLLGLAKKMGGKLATCDATIPLGAVKGATRATLAVISS